MGREVTQPETIPAGTSNPENFGCVMNFLIRMQTEKELKGCHIYTATLENIGPYVNRNKFLKEQLSN